MKKHLSLLFALWCFATSLIAQSFSMADRSQKPLPAKLPSEVAEKSAGHFSAPTSEYDDYGGKIGFGVSIFNGFGMPVRYYLSPKKVIEGGVYIGAVAIWEQNNGGNLELLAYEPNFMLGAGYSYFGNRFLKQKKHKSKVRAHGLAVRGQYLVGDFKTAFASLGWAMETFRKDRKNNSFIFELGLQGAFPNFVYNNVEYSKGRPGLYLRCHWNFFLK